MISSKHIIRLLLCGLLYLAVIGCVSGSYIEHRQYLLNVKTLPAKTQTQYKDAVIVDRITAIPPFDQLDFLYRIDSYQYLTDYYHGFLVSPTEQLEPLVINYLKSLGNFNLDTSGLATAQNKLQVQITEFYADYRERNHPKAVIALRFILTKLVAKKPVILLDKILRAEVALKEKTTNSLLVTWNLCLQDVLTRGADALNTALSN